MSQPEQFRIRDYQVEKALARGGMATVFLAKDTRDGRVVALKQILPHIAEDREFIERFRHEVKIHSQLHHPNILEILEFADGPTEYFISMEYIDGGTLKFLIDRLRKFPTEIALFVTREVLNGLSAAHARGVIHRDIKPHNVMITRAGAVKVGDFGISKTDQMTRLTQTGELIGTPAYMSPEQASGVALDPRSDIFSTGVMLYEMLAGTNPFFTGNPATTIRKIVDFVPDGLFEVDPTIPIECEALVNRMIAKNPDQRFPNAQTAVAAVDARLQALGLPDPERTFRQFLQTPKQYVDERNARVAAVHLERGRQMLESGQASAEVALWEIFQAKKVAGESAEASELMATITSKTGYKVDEDRQAENAKIKALEDRLKEEPENVQLLLQLAKLYKLEKDFVGMMRFFLKLKSLEVDDAYLQNQIAALVAMPGGGAVATPGGGSPVAGAKPGPAPAGAARPAVGSKAGAPLSATPAPVPLSKMGIPKPLLFGGIAALFLVALGVRSIMKEAASTGGSTENPLAATAPEGIDRSEIQGEAGVALERARKLEEAGDKAAAAQTLETWISKNPDNPGLDAVHLRLGNLYDGQGLNDRAIDTYGKVVTGRGGLEKEARAARGDLYVRLGKGDDARPDFETLVSSGDPRWIPVGHWNLGRLALGQSDTSGAMDHFDPLVRDFPTHDLANEARLEIARIRLEEGNFDIATNYALEAQRTSKVGGETHRRAGQVLADIEAKRQGAPAAPLTPTPEG